MIKTIIVDDEKQARDGLLSLLRKDPDIDIVEICKNGLEAIEAIRLNAPDLLFLDIQMPGINGFEVLNSIESQNLPQTVFVTAYDEFALKAFEVHAVDYLLKPFSDRRFYDSLKNAKSHLSNIKDYSNSVKAMLKNTIREELGSSTSSLVATGIIRKRLIIKNSGKVILLGTDNIVRIEADNYYIKIYDELGKFHQVRESLTKIMERLPNNYFIRIHRSHIVNVNWIEEIDILGHSEFGIRLKNNEYVYSGRTYKDSMQKIIGNYYT